MSRYRNVKKWKNLFGNIDENQLINSLNEEVPRDIEAAIPDTRKSSIGSDDTESPTPDFEWPRADSISSKPTQEFEQYTRPFDYPETIYSADTLEITETVYKLHNRADVDDNPLARIRDQCKISELNDSSNFLSISSRNISCDEMPTQKNIESENHRPHSTRNSLKVTSPRQLQSCTSSPSVHFPRKTSKKQQNVPDFNIVDIDDFSQLPTPNIDYYKLLTSKSESSSITQANLVTEKYFQENDGTEVVIEEAEEIPINNELKRKRKLDREAITTTKDKKNGPVIINVQQVEILVKKTGLDIGAKNHSHLHDTLNLVPLIENLTTKSPDACSPDNASPENKKRRLSTPVSPIFKNKYGRSTPLQSVEGENALGIVDVTEGDNTNIGINVSNEEYETNTSEESSVILGKDSEKRPATKSASQVKPFTIGSNDSWNIKTPAESSLEVVANDKEQNGSKTSMANEKQSAIVVNDPTDKSVNAFSPESVASENRKTRPSLDQALPISKIKKRIVMLDLTQEDEMNTTKNSSVIPREDFEKEPAAKSVSEIKQSTITRNDSWDIETPTESSLEVIGNDREQNGSKMSMASEKQSAIVVNDPTDKSVNAFSPESVASENRKTRPSLDQALPISKIKKRIVMLDLTQEDEMNTTKNSSVIPREDFEKEPAAKSVSEIKESTITRNDSWDIETGTESSLEVVGNDREQNGSKISMVSEKQSAIVVNDPTEKSDNAFSPEGAASENEKKSINSHQVSSISKIKKRILMLDLTQEDETNTIEDSSVILGKDSEQRPATKSASQVKPFTIASNDSWDIEMTTESSLEVVANDREQNGSKISMADGKQTAIVINDPTEKRKNALPHDSTTSENKQRRLGRHQILPIRKMNKRVEIVDLTQEDQTHTDEELPVVIRTNPHEKSSANPAPKVKMPRNFCNNVSGVEMTKKSSLNVTGGDKKQNASQKLMNRKRRSAFVDNNAVSAKAKGTRRIAASPQSMLDQQRTVSIVNDVWDVTASAKSTLDTTGNEEKQSGLKKSIFEENRSSIVINDADGRATADSTILSPTDGDECSTSSASTNSTQSSSFVSTLLSDRCSEYNNNCLLDQNSWDFKTALNTINVINFEAALHLDQQINNVLTFLETDIDAK